MELDPAKLRQWRERRLLTQVELAAKAGRTEATINRLERGHNRATLRTIRQLATALEIDADDLIMNERTAPAPKGKRRREARPESTDVEEA